MNVIVAVDQNWGIGLQDQLQFCIKADLRHFRSLTVQRTVILGRKTLQTFPGGVPLKDRTHLILSRQTDLHIAGAEVFSNVSDLLERCKSVLPDDLFVIGGASVYQLLLPYCSRAYVTLVLSEKPADRYFPNLDLDPSWKLVEEGPIQHEDETRFRFLIYEKVV